ncbi:MAG: hypothetical protein GY765_21160 [bacterium]|nr:hypothetical protein [bacterium]
MKKATLVFILVMSCLFSFAGTTLDFSGYFENRFYMVEDGDAPLDNLKEKFDLGDYNRLRLILKASPSKKVTVNMAVDFFSFHGFITSPLGTNEQVGADETKEFKINLDRAYVNLYFKKFDVTIGKQRVAMGVSYIWAPLDVFNRVNVMEPKEEKPGANAFKVYIPIKNSTSLTAVFSPDNEFNTSRSGLRLKTQVAGVDGALTFIRDGIHATSIYGVDLRGENFLGWWVEAGYFVSSLRKSTKIVLGFDYTFPLKDGLYWLNELYYDSSGEKDFKEYDFSLAASGERFTLGRKYLLSMLSYGFSDFIKGSCSYIGNLDDGSGFINPSLRYEISQSVSLAGGFYILIGKEGREFRGRNTRMLYLWLKVNF